MTSFDPKRFELHLAAEREKLELAVFDESKHPRIKGKWARVPHSVHDAISSLQDRTDEANSYVDEDWEKESVADRLDVDAHDLGHPASAVKYGPVPGLDKNHIDHLVVDKHIIVPDHEEVGRHVIVTPHGEHLAGNGYENKYKVIKPKKERKAGDAPYHDKRGATGPKAQ